MDEDVENVLYQPLRLFDQCLNKCIKYPSDTLILKNTNDGHDSMDIDDVDSFYHDNSKDTWKMRLRTSSFVPDNICELLFQQIINLHDFGQYMSIFADTTKCKLTTIDVSQHKLGIQDTQLLSTLFHHPLQELNLSGCDISSSSLNILKGCAQTLRLLDLSSVPNLKEFSIIKDLKNLQKLNLSDTDIGFRKEDLTYIGNLKHLLWLDLSGSAYINDMNIAELLPLNRTLAFLSLYNCRGIQHEETLFNFLQHFTNLVHLDISKHPEADNQENPDHPPIVNHLVLTALSQLPKLLSLDLSGNVGLTEDDIIPFSRNTKLKFLGLAFTGLSLHRNLPAETITGEANEEQVLNSLEHYIKRQKYVLIVLRKLFALARFQNCRNVEKCLKLILACMRTYPQNENINIAATASMYHLSRNDHPADKAVEIRREIVDVILTSMNSAEDILQLQKNCCLILCTFRIPAELEYQWFPVAKALLTALSKHKDNYLRRIAIMLFNTIVCQITGQQKRKIGELGAVKMIIEIIQEKIDVGEADQLLETCWSSLWNMTDETQENCRDFLNNRGMDVFVKCLELFPQKNELKRNMMGLMGNIAEVPELRSRMVTDEYVKIFVSLLSDQRYLEVCYNAGGVLSHMLSDGPNAWHVQSMTRNQCMETMFYYINKWDIQADRNINYRSFKPILKLLPCEHAPAAQHWAIWAFANLTKVYPHKYCRLFEQEEGLVYLEHVQQMNTAYTKTKQLAKIVQNNCKNELSFR